MTLQQKLLSFANHLLTVSNNVYHYYRPANYAVPYIVWAEDGEDGSFHAGNKKAEQTIHGTIEVYTQTEFDALLDWVQDALLQLDGCGWILQAAQYEEETNLIHYTYEWWWACGTTTDISETGA